MRSKVSAQADTGNQEAEALHGKSDRRREDRRDQLLDVAMRLYSKYGLEGTTTKDIAREAQVSPGLLYHYYTSKEELLIDVVKRFHDNSQLDNIVAQNNNGTVREAFMQILTALRSFFAAHLEEVWLVTRAAARFPAVAEALIHMRASGSNVFREFLNARAAAGEIIQVAEPDRLAGVLFQILVSELMMGNGCNGSVEPIVDTLLYGLVPRDNNGELGLAGQPS